MSDPVNFAETLAERARKETPPQVDVSHAVTIRLNCEPEASQWPVLCFTTGVVLVAAWIAVTSSTLVLSILDPLASLFQFPPDILM